MQDKVAVVQHSAQHKRAVEVWKELTEILTSDKKNFLDTCELLHEIQQDNLSAIWGYPTFFEWVEKGSNLDIGTRQAYHMVGIARKIKALGIDKSKIGDLSITKLKHIFSLDEKKFGEEIKGLLEQATMQSIEEVQAAVQGLKNGTAPEEAPKYMTLKLDPAVKKTVDDALELARANYGHQVQEGDATDISVSKCMELICLSYVQDANNQGEV